MLHIINKSPFSHSALSDCLRVCTAEAAILLIEDGVYAALRDGEWAKQLMLAGAAVFVLAPDITARGLDQRIENHFARIDYAGFVELCCSNNPTQSWY